MPNILWELHRNDLQFFYFTLFNASRYFRIIFFDFKKKLAKTNIHAQHDF